jgi:hypothetical protein
VAAVELAMVLQVHKPAKPVVLVVALEMEFQLLEPELLGRVTMVELRTLVAAVAVAVNLPLELVP